MFLLCLVYISIFTNVCILCDEREIIRVCILYYFLPSSVVSMLCILIFGPFFRTFRCIKRNIVIMHYEYFTVCFSVGLGVIQNLINPWHNSVQYQSITSVLHCLPWQDYSGSRRICTFNRRGNTYVRWYLLMIPHIYKFQDNIKIQHLLIYLFYF